MAKLYMRQTTSTTLTQLLLTSLFFVSSFMAKAGVLETFHLTKAEKEIHSALDASGQKVPEGFNGSDLSFPEKKISKERLAIVDVLKMAIVNNPTIQERRESLSSSALRFHGAMHSYTPQLTGTLSYILSGTESVSKNENYAQAFGLSQKTGAGGTVQLNFSGSQNRTNNSEYSSGVSVNLNQPLLKGFGRDISREDYVQGKRSLTYELRAFKRFIDSFAIGIIREYTGIVNLRTKTDNLERRHLKDVWLYKKTLAFFNVGRVSKLELLRVNQRKHSSQSQWKKQVQILQNNMESFKLKLNLDPEDPLDLMPFEATYETLSEGVEEQVAKALLYRLDYKTSHDNLECETALWIRKKQPFARSIVQC